MTDRCDQAQEIMTRFAGKETSWDENQEIYGRYLVHTRACAQCTRHEIEDLCAKFETEKALSVKKDKKLIALREKQIAKLNARLQTLSVKESVAA